MRTLYDHHFPYFSPEVSERHFMIHIERPMNLITVQYMHFCMKVKFTTNLCGFSFNRFLFKTISFKG